MASGAIQSSLHRGEPMIDLYFWPTPNGLKLKLGLEETALPYRAIPVNIGNGEQFQPSFLAISPNNRIPALVDHDPAADMACYPTRRERCCSARTRQPCGLSAMPPRERLQGR